MSSNPATAGETGSEPNHARRFTAIWLLATAICLPIAIFVIGPIMPPGNGSEQAAGEVTDNTVLLAMATPVLLLVTLYLIYAVIVFRQPKGGVLEGPAIRGDAKIQTAWIVITSLLVLSLAAGYPANGTIGYTLETRSGDSTNYANVYVGVACSSNVLDNPTIVEASPLPITATAASARTVTSGSITPNSGGFPACSASQRVWINLRVDTNVASHVMTQPFDLVSALFSVQGSI